MTRPRFLQHPVIYIPTNNKQTPAASARSAVRMPSYPPLAGIRLLLQLQPSTPPVGETLVRERRPVRVCSPAEGEEPVSFRDSFPANQRRPGLPRAPRLPGVVGGAAPGGGESLSGAAAASSNRNAQGRGGPAGSTWRRERGRRGCARSWDVPGLRRRLSRRDPDRDGGRGESREETVASVHCGGPV